MIDEKIKTEYSKLAPTEKCRERILEAVMRQSRQNEFKSRISALKRIGSIAAALAIVIAAAVLGASGVFEQSRFGVYYNGELISEQYELRVASEASEFSARGISNKGATLELELCGKNATVTVSGGELLGAGRELTFSGKRFVKWTFTESGSYELTLKSGDEQHKLSAVYDAESNTVKLKTN